MMLHSLAPVSLLLVVGCSSADNSTSTSQPNRLTSCRKEDRVGTYLFHMAERPGGNCGPVKDQLVQLQSDPPATTTSPGGVVCKLTASSLSEGDCKADTTVECLSPGGTSKSISVARQTAQDGSAMSGTVTMTVSTGSTFCQSTYDVMWTRQ